MHPLFHDSPDPNRAERRGAAIGGIDRITVHLAHQQRRDHHRGHHRHGEGEAAMGQFQHQHQSGQRSLHHGADHGGRSNEGERADRRAGPEVRPHDAQESTEHGPGAEERGEDAARRALPKVSAVTNGLRAKSANNSPLRRVRGTRRGPCLTVPEELRVPDPHDANHEKASGIFQKIDAPEARCADTQPMRRT